MDGFRIFTDTQISTIINKAKTAITYLQLEAVREYAYGDFKKGDKIQLKAASLNLKVNQLENSSSMTDDQKANLAQGIIVEGELEKYERIYDYIGCNGVVSDIINISLPLDHLTDLTNTGSNTHTQIDAHIANTSNPHEVDVSDVISQQGLSSSKGNILSFDDSGNPLMQTITFDRVMTSNALSPTGFSWDKIGPAYYEDFPSFSFLARNAGSSGAPAYFSIAANSVVGRISGNITNIIVSNDSTMSNNSSSQIPTQAAARGYVDSKLSSTGYKFFVVNNGTYGQWDTIASNSVLGRLGGGIVNISILDEDEMTSNDNSSLATQQSIKQYSDGHIASINVSSKVKSPSASEDGYAITYDHSNSIYKLTSVSGGAGLWTDDTADTISYNTGSSPKVLIGAGSQDANAMLDVRGSAVFNEGGDSVDFRVESNTSTHMLFVDGSANRVGINNPNPVYRLDLNDGSAKITTPTGEVNALRLNRLSSTFLSGVGTVYTLQNDNNEEVAYAATYGIVRDNTDGAEFGGWKVQTMRDGTLSDSFSIRDDDFSFFDASVFNLVSEGTSSTILFRADNSSGSKVDYAQINFTVEDNSFGAQSGGIVLGALNNNSYSAFLKVNGDSLLTEFNLPFLAFKNTETAVEALLPAEPDGTVYYDTNLNKLRVRSNGVWVNLH